jgi:hypothetical protein
VRLGAVAIAALLAWTAVGASAAEPKRRDVGPNTSALYVKECGSCHFPYQPGWLPERSWRQIMGSLSRHYGENAEISAANHAPVLAYLVAGSAERANNTRSREIMAAIKPGETPTSVTGVLYVGGIHGGFLDQAFRGKPAVKTLAQCPACHDQAERGWFSPVTYEISDESFRSMAVDLSDVPFFRNVK